MIRDGQRFPVGQAMASENLDRPKRERWSGVEWSGSGRHGLHVHIPTVRMGFGVGRVGWAWARMVFNV